MRRELPAQANALAEAVTEPKKEEPPTARHIDKETMAYWRTFSLGTPLRSHEAIMRGADAVLRLVAFTVPAWVAVLTLGGVGWHYYFAIPYLLWLAAMSLAWQTMMPEAWTHDESDMGGVKDRFLKLVDDKRKRIQLAATFFALGLVSACVIFAWQVAEMPESTERPSSASTP